MTMSTATTLTAIVHPGVFVTASGDIKIAATPRKKWRMWIYEPATDTWRLQPAVFKRYQDAAAAAELAEKLVHS